MVQGVKSENKVKVRRVFHREIRMGINKEIDAL
jgi:hypothetical protein